MRVSNVRVDSGVTPEARDAFSRVVAGLAERRIEWCIFGGAAASFYGVTRPIVDVDIFLRTDDEAAVVELFPQGKRIGRTGLALSAVELWWGDLVLAAGQSVHRFAFDDRMLERRLVATFLGVDAWLMSAEDVLVMKAILQRGPSQGKHDLDDVGAIARTCGDRLDRAYVLDRAAACECRERVASVLAALTSEGVR